MNCYQVGAKFHELLNEKTHPDDPVHNWVVGKAFEVGLHYYNSWAVQNGYEELTFDKLLRVLRPRELVMSPVSEV